jgi:hypothetical protein
MAGKRKVVVLSDSDDSPVRATYAFDDPMHMPAGAVAEGQCILMTFAGEALRQEAAKTPACWPRQLQHSSE